MAEPTPSAADPTVVVSIPPSEQPGDRIGRYKILQTIGEGGCGIVYLAEQEQPVRRRVALKVIKLGMDTKSVIARFEAERQVLALMDHPNIAKVLDAGATETGRPFFVMELVRGVPITEYCDEARLLTEKRLDLFVQVCRAVQHAHQKGIIHRDLKPSNILVTINDGVAVPKVIDFGIAKATTDQRLTDKTLFTAYEQFIGTPAYMSPEQALMTSLDIDTRSDIYSLGVLLYELLTGKTPFDARELLQSGFDEMRRTIREKDPERPSTRLGGMPQQDLTSVANRRQLEAPRLIHLLRGDLDWVAMKALEKDRTRRYDTAEALAADVQRYLDNEPVSARPPSKLYRFQKLARRNRTAFAAASGVALALLAGMGVSLHLYLREKDARQRAIAAEREQSRLREEAEAGRALEARMRAQAEAGKVYAEVGLLLARRDFAEAERLVNTVPASPNAASIYSVLAFVHGAHENWSGALSNYAKVMGLASGDYFAYSRYASVLVQIGDVSAYQKHCLEILRRFGSTTNPVVAARCAEDCLILPAAGVDLSAVARMVETALAAGPEHRAWRSFQFAKGLTEYRQGRFAGAADWSQQITNSTGNMYRMVQAQAVLAMAQHQLKQPDQARVTLKSALETADKRFPPAGKANLDDNWHDWIVSHALMREAQALIGSSP